MIGEVRFSLVVSLDGADCHPFPYSTHPQKLLTLGLEYHWISLVVSVQKSQGVQEHHSVLTMGDGKDDYFFPFRLFFFLSYCGARSNVLFVFSFFCGNM